MRITKRVDLEGANVARQQGEILRGGGEHVPGIEVEEGHEEVEADGCRGGDDEVREDVVAELLLGFGVAELHDDDVDGGEGGVGHDDAVRGHAAEEHFLGALRAVAHAEDELDADGQHAGVTQNVEYVLSNIVAKGVEFGISERTRNEVKGEVEVGEREEGEHELNELIDELDVQKGLAHDGVVSCPDLFEV